jgi:hypothetical protein
MQRENEGVVVTRPDPVYPINLVATGKILCPRLPIPFLKHPVSDHFSYLL